MEVVLKDAYAFIHERKLSSIQELLPLVRVALQNAASVAGLMLTTEALIAERPDGSADGSGMHDDMGGLGMEET